jgi:molybdopterin-guanine dinucleotide biosynthesis protein A
MAEGLAAAVLAGGEGRRMGGLKALRPFHGRPLVAHAVALAGRWSGAVAVVARRAEQVAGATDAELVLDRADVPGPLAGLAAALAWARERGAERLITLPVDLPHAPADLYARLEAALSPQHGAALPRAGGRLQPASGLWRVAAVDRLPDYLAGGRSSLWGFAEHCGLAVVDYADEEAWTFANANSVEALARIEGGTG